LAGGAGTGAVGDNSAGHVSVVRQLSVTRGIIGTTGAGVDAVVRAPAAGRAFDGGAAPAPTSVAMRCWMRSITPAMSGSFAFFLVVVLAAGTAP
jgi:hypothetical protein